MAIKMPVCQIALSSTDLRRTSWWYRNTFGWRAAGEVREMQGDIWAEVPGLPEAHFRVWWLNEAQRFFQFEVFEFTRPRMRAECGSRRPNDVGYAGIGLRVGDFDGVLNRLRCTGGSLLTPPVGPAGQRRVCLRDPEGVLLELIEAAPQRAAHSGAADALLATVSSITVSVHDLDSAVAFWVALGLAERKDSTLHAPEHERLWNLDGAARRSCVLDGGTLVVELVQYVSPEPRNRAAGHLLSDQGILNVALGTTDRSTFDVTFERVQAAGFRSCREPWTVPGLATVAYMQDGQGSTVELLCVEPQALPRMGFPSGVSDDSY